MAIVVVGGGGRGVGKTALACGVMAALPEQNWIAVKIASHAHGAGQSLWEEAEAGAGTDTARYLAAGARRAFLLTAADDAEMKAALDGLWAAVGREANLLFESNRVSGFVKANACLLVDGCATTVDAKASYELAVQYADAIVLRGETGRPQVREESRPVFCVERFERLSPELADWIRGRLIYG